jgi:hypothetical protein
MRGLHEHKPRDLAGASTRPKARMAARKMVLVGRRHDQGISQQSSRSTDDGYLFRVYQASVKVSQNRDQR